MGDPVFGNAANWNSSMLKDAGPLLAGLDPAFVQSLDSDALYDAFTNMNQTVREGIKFPKSTVSIPLLYTCSYHFYFYLSISLLQKFFRRTKCENTSHHENNTNDYEG